MTSVKLPPLPRPYTISPFPVVPVAPISGGIGAFTVIIYIMVFCGIAGAVAWRYYKKHTKCTEEKIDGLIKGLENAKISAEKSRIDSIRTLDLFKSLSESASVGGAVKAREAKTLAFDLQKSKK